tara:strand:- start:1028 stop:1726 length:699 start_codon:yes stop_codon:yes gene_type:complete
MNNSLVSVIMSAHNAEKTIEKAINSLLNQTYTNLEILLVDDFSSDRTLGICEDFDKSYENITLFRNDKNIGLTRSLNKLINKSKGVYIARQDADDVSAEGRIEKQLTFLRKHNLDACSSRAYILESNKITPSKSFYLPKKLVMRIKNPFIHGTLLIKKKVIQEIGLYNEDFYYSQDYKLMSDLLNENFRIKVFKEPLYYLNMKGNISINQKEDQKYYADCVRKKIKPVKVKK